MGEAKPMSTGTEDAARLRIAHERAAEVKRLFGVMAKAVVDAPISKADKATVIERMEDAILDEWCRCYGVDLNVPRDPSEIGRMLRFTKAEEEEIRRRYGQSPVTITPVGATEAEARARSKAFRRALRSGAAKPPTPPSAA
jgi:hypothetical protein